MDQFRKLFDTTNPDNQLGPLILAILIAIVAAVILGGFGIAGHHKI